MVQDTHSVLPECSCRMRYCQAHPNEGRSGAVWGTEQGTGKPGTRWRLSRELELSWTQQRGSCRVTFGAGPSLQHRAAAGHGMGRRAGQCPGTGLSGRMAQGRIGGEGLQLDKEGLLVSPNGVGELTLWTSRVPQSPRRPVFFRTLKAQSSPTITISTAMPSARACSRARPKFSRSPV